MEIYCTSSLSANPLKLTLVFSDLGAFTGIPLEPAKTVRWSLVSSKAIKYAIISIIHFVDAVEKISFSEDARKDFAQIILFT